MEQHPPHRFEVGPAAPWPPRPGSGKIDQRHPTLTGEIGHEPNPLRVVCELFLVRNPSHSKASWSSSALTASAMLA